MWAEPLTRGRAHRYDIKNRRTLLKRSDYPAVTPAHLFIGSELTVYSRKLKITAYGDRLLGDLDDLDWPESIKEMQRNWIGRSEGAQLAFEVPGVTGDENKLEVYTTRPDTLFGATYLVVAPEHPLVGALSTAEQKAAVDAYVDAASRKSDLERTELAKEKTGVFTGSHAKHPLTGADVPVWVADYVLGTYGTGAISWPSCRSRTMTVR